MVFGIHEKEKDGLCELNKLCFLFHYYTYKFNFVQRTSVKKQYLGTDLLLGTLIFSQASRTHGYTDLTTQGTLKFMLSLWMPTKLCIPFIGWENKFNQSLFYNSTKKLWAERDERRFHQGTKTQVEMLRVI